MNRYLILIISVLVCTVYGCDTTEEPTTSGTYTLAFKLKEDSTYRYTVKNNIVIAQNVGEDNTITINQNMTLMSAYEILSKTDKGRSVSVTYEKITMSSGNQLFSLDYDSETDNGVDPMYEGLRRLIDKSYTIEISDIGKVVSSEPAQIDTSLTGNIYGINDSSIRKIMLHCLELYPADVVHIGDIWERSYTSSVGFATVRIRNKYQLVAVEKDVAKIEMQGRVSSNNSSLQNDEVELKGIESGSFEIDLSTGLIKNGKIIQKLAGNMNITGEDAPVELESQIYIMGMSLPELK